MDLDVLLNFPEMYFQIVTINPNNYIHSLAFAELEKSLYEAFISIGIPVQRSSNILSPSRRNLIIGWHLLSESYEHFLPQLSIIYNLEQMDPCNQVLIDRLVRLSERHIIWDYNMRNIEILRKAGARGKIMFAPIGIMPSLRQIPINLNKDIDVLFYGSVNSRRKYILDLLKGNGINIHVAFGVYGPQRDELISRSKIVLNLHFYDTSILEMVRLSYLFFNSKAVVSECYDNSDIPIGLENAALFSSYHGLIDACKYLLLNDSERGFLESNSFACMTHFSQTVILKKLLTDNGF